MLQSNHGLGRMTKDTSHGSVSKKTGSDQNTVDDPQRYYSEFLNRYNNVLAHRQKLLCATDLSINGLGYYGVVSQVLNSLIAQAKTL